MPRSGHPGTAQAWPRPRKASTQIGATCTQHSCMWVSSALFCFCIDFTVKLKNETFSAKPKMSQIEGCGLTTTTKHRTEVEVQCVPLTPCQSLKAEERHTCHRRKAEPTFTPGPRVQEAEARATLLSLPGGPPSPEVSRLWSTLSDCSGRLPRPHEGPGDWSCRGGGGNPVASS